MSYALFRRFLKLSLNDERERDQRSAAWRLEPQLQGCTAARLFESFKRRRKKALASKSLVLLIDFEKNKEFIIKKQKTFFWGKKTLMEYNL